LVLSYYNIIAGTGHRLVMAVAACNDVS